MKRGHSGAHYKIEIAVAGKNAKQYRQCMTRYISILMMQ
jgi:hypothetical protein